MSNFDTQIYEAILPDSVTDLNDLSCDEYQKLAFRIYQDRRCTENSDGRSIIIPFK